MAMPWREKSLDRQRDQSHAPDAQNQHHERQRVVVEPIPCVYTHDAPRLQTKRLGAALVPLQPSGGGFPWRLVARTGGEVQRSRRVGLPAMPPPRLRFNGASRIHPEINKSTARTRRMPGPFPRHLGQHRPSREQRFRRRVLPWLRPYLSVRVSIVHLELPSLRTEASAVENCSSTWRVAAPRC